jgi:hypothetical protein
MNAGLLGYDFYFTVIGKGKRTVRHVRLYEYFDSVRPQYEKEGFRIEPSTIDEYRAANWKKTA